MVMRSGEITWSATNKLNSVTDAAKAELSPLTLTSNAQQVGGWVPCFAACRAGHRPINIHTVTGPRTHASSSHGKSNLCHDAVPSSHWALDSKQIDQRITILALRLAWQDDADILVPPLSTQQ